MPKRYLITSALPYINGVKHLGNLIGSMLPADVLSRFLRQSGEDVLFICGTDEHGTPAEIAAQEAGIPVEEYCSQMYALQKKIYEGFHIKFDYFGRTSSESNHELTTKIFKALFTNGYIEEKYINQYYSFEDQRFLPDRYVEGTCPYCGYEKARGDQCDGCGKLLNPEDLIKPYSSISHSTNIALQKTLHFFLNMPKLTFAVSAWINQQEQWSDIVKGIAKKWLNEGLISRCITRDLKWGIPVPLEWIEEQKAALSESSQTTPGHQETPQNKVFYVWFDAPNGYISITKDCFKQSNNPDEWKKWWLPENSEDVYYIEFMAKDNVPFHAVFWPSILIGTNLPFKKVDDIKGFHWLTYENGKFSTSQKRGIFSDTALELFPADYWRYYLLSNCPESADSDFNFKSFAAIINKDLADILGNFTNRTIALLKKYANLTINLTLTEETLNKALIEKCTAILHEISDHLSNRSFRQATAALRSLWVLGNEYITQQEPWHTLKTNPQEGEITLIHCIHLLRIFAIASYPFIPSTAHEIFKILQDDENLLATTPIQNSIDFQYFPSGHIIKETHCLFSKIDDAQVDQLTETFSGK